MSDYYKKLEEQLRYFLNDENKKILMLHGTWGIGKTYFWKNFIQTELKGQRGIRKTYLWENFTKTKLRTQSGFRAYSYVSLFGKVSLSDIYSEIVGRAIFLNRITKEFKVSKASQTLKILKKLPYMKEYEGLVNLTENFILKNFLICFDDIERKPSSINISTFLGLCDQLREEHNCKVVIILSEEELKKNEEDYKQLQNYREKVIDQAILFNPTKDDNYRLIFNETYEKVYIDLIKKYEILNLRILQKIKWNLTYHLKYLDGSDEAVKIFFIERIIVLTYLASSNITSGRFDEICGEYIAGQTPKDLLEFKNSIFAKYGYYHDQRDEVLINYIKHSTSNEKKLNEYVNDENQKERVSKIRREIDNFWKIYRSNFKVEPERLLENAKKIMNTKISYLSIQDVESFMKLIRIVEPKFDEDNYWEKYIDSNIEKIDRINLAQLKNRVNQVTLKSKIESILSSTLDNISVNELVYKISRNNSWNPAETYKLSKVNVDEFYAWLISEEDSDLLMIIANFLTIFNTGSNDAVHKKIGETLRDALLRIAKIDKLKEFQIERILKISNDEAQG